MNEGYVNKLISKAEEVASIMSNPERKFNINNETFELKEVVPRSDLVAHAIYNKSSGKQALVVFYFVHGFDDWQWFFPTDSHLLGFAGLSKIKLEVEKNNFNIKNFNSIPETIIKG